MIKNQKQISKPEILAPAGNKESFLAALAAGADAIYCGLKEFSARMAAHNFSMAELAALTRLAHKKGAVVYVTLNTLLKPADLDRMGSLLLQLQRWVNPDAVIVQDLAMIDLVRQAGYTGELHFSTLANAGFPVALKELGKHAGVTRVVLPRELSIDEIKAMAAACPSGLRLEVFVHGALCYGVSGRCYWSSYMGGKSGLRGQCVQPCRRLYAQQEKRERFFSCLDLSLDVLAKTLLSVPEISAFKIEGRKKGPHYVYYTVKAYQMMRDFGTEPAKKKAALALLSHALNRPGTHYYFLPQRPQIPLDIHGQTGSGLLVGKVNTKSGKAFFKPREALLPGDVLRVGYEDQKGHMIEKNRRFVPRGGKLLLKPTRGTRPAKDMPVFLIDRREQALAAAISKMETALEEVSPERIKAINFSTALPERYSPKPTRMEVGVFRDLKDTPPKGGAGLWLSADTPIESVKRISPRLWWWLPPVVWPDQEKALRERIDFICKRGARNVVINAPWQAGFFKQKTEMNLWAGPFCNLSNALALKAVALMGCKGAVVSPELGGDDYLALPRHSPLPLGIVLSGSWPLCVSRTLSAEFKPDTLFVSPKGEGAYVRRYGADFWVYPDWQLDITTQKAALLQVGYRLFFHLNEPLPSGVRLKKRPGKWNWEVGLR